MKKIRMAFFALAAFALLATSTGCGGGGGGGSDDDDTPVAESGSTGGSGAESGASTGSGPGSGSSESGSGNTSSGTGNESTGGSGTGSGSSESGSGNTSTGTGSGSSESGSGNGSAVGCSISASSLTVSETIEGSRVFIKGRTVEIWARWCSDHEVTQSEYERYCSYGGDESPSDTYGIGSNYPAYFVSWYDALVYCNRRSIGEHLTPCYTINNSTNPDDWGSVPTEADETWDAVTCDFTANGYRLPTEVEWEYLARGGNTSNSNQTIYSGSDTIDDVAWYPDNSGGKTHEVKTKAPNALGLYDMSGNVWEFCWDWRSSESRVRRGGTWNHRLCELGKDDAGLSPFRRNFDYGFRVVRSSSN
ncbi:MAG: SUMF1/EgtB/PvdO family nonheme iron enzyme [Treponema sp.]|nr:SUMF1/EgtB/PvdO family nonheme iron enzyme [Treponema sp.]